MLWWLLAGASDGLAGGVGLAPLFRILILNDDDDDDADDSGDDALPVSGDDERMGGFLLTTRAADVVESDISLNFII